RAPPSFPTRPLFRSLPAHGVLHEDVAVRRAVPVDGEVLADAELAVLGLDAVAQRAEERLGRRPVAGGPDDRVDADVGLVELVVVPHGELPAAFGAVDGGDG